MTNLELAREVNDALQKPDFSVAFALLKAQQELRASELPSVEQKSLKALEKALLKPKNAQIWAEALLDEAASLRLFAAKTLLRLRGAANPVAAPLQAAFLNVPQRLQVYPQVEWAKHIAQQEMLSRAAEVLFCADPTGTFQFLEHNLKTHMSATRAQAEEHARFEQRQKAAQDTLQTAMQELVAAEHGQHEPWAIHWLSPEVRADIYGRAKLRPDVAKLWDEIGEEPTQSGPLFSFAALSGGIQRLAKSKSEPQKSVLEQLREPLWGLVEMGLKPGGENEAAFAQLILSFGAMPNGAGLFPDAFFLERAPRLLAAVRENADDEATLNRLDDNISLAHHPPRSRLWAWTALAVLNAFGRDRQPQPHAWPTPKASALLRILWLKENTAFHLHRRVVEAAATFGGLEPRQATPQVKITATQSNPDENSVEEFESMQREGETASEFVQRTETEFQVYFQQLSLANIPGQRHSILVGEAHAKFHKAILDLTDEEKREVIEETAGQGDTTFGQILRAWQMTELHNIAQNEATSLSTLSTAQLWEYCQQTLADISSAQNTSLWGRETPQLQAARLRFENAKRVLLASEGEAAWLRLIQAAQRLKVNFVVQGLESEILSSYLDRFPDSDSHQGWTDWKLDERADPILEHLAKRVARWPVQNRQWANGQLATGFYRRFTHETRQRCWELLAQTSQISRVLFGAIDVCRDINTWLVALNHAQQRDSRFLQFWQRPHDADTRERLVGRLIETLGNASTDPATALILRMLADVDNLASYIPQIISTLESPRPQAAQWALITLLRLGTPDTDWPRAIEAAGEKLWSENAELSKLAAKFLGTAPDEHAALAWKKLAETTALDNKPLLEAVLRAMAALKKRNRDLRMDKTAREQLAALAQLAPERFEKLTRKLEI